MKSYDLIIIGAGPAGLSAAIYARRGNLNTLIIEQSLDGGKLSKISDIDNYPGYQTISGFELYSKMLKQAKSYNPEIISGKVTKILDHKVMLENNEEYGFKALIIATGTSQRKLDIPFAKEYIGKGISYCATCDGFFFRNKEVVVIAENGNALTEILYLANLVAKVHIISSRNNLIGEENLINKIQKLENVDYLYECQAQELIIDNDKIIGLKVKNANNQIIAIKAEAIFPYISNNPSTNFVDTKLLDNNGFIEVDKQMKTNFDDIYAAGDCTNASLKQVVTACSDGAIAATNIIKLLK